MDNPTLSYVHLLTIDVPMCVPPDMGIISMYFPCSTSPTQCEMIFNVYDGSHSIFNWILLVKFVLVLSILPGKLCRKPPTPASLSIIKNRHMEVDHFSIIGVAFFG